MAQKKVYIESVIRVGVHVVLTIRLEDGTSVEFRTWEEPVDAQALADKIRKSL